MLKLEQVLLQIFQPGSGFSYYAILVIITITPSLTCTFSASTSLSWKCSMALTSVTPGLSAESSTIAETSPTSVSFSDIELNEVAKWNREDTNSFCNKVYNYLRDDFLVSFLYLFWRWKLINTQFKGGLKNFLKLAKIKIVPRKALKLI